MSREYDTFDDLFEAIQDVYSGVRDPEQLKQVLQQNWKKLSDPREPLKSQASRKQVSAGRITEVDSKGLEKRIDLKKEEVEYTLRLSDLLGLDEKDSFLLLKAADQRTRKTRQPGETEEAKRRRIKKLLVRNSIRIYSHRRVKLLESLLMLVHLYEPGGWGDRSNTALDFVNHFVENKLMQNHFIDNLFELIREQYADGASHGGGSPLLTQSEREAMRAEDVWIATRILLSYFSKVPLMDISSVRNFIIMLEQLSRGPSGGVAEDPVVAGNRRRVCHMLLIALSTALDKTLPPAKPPARPFRPAAAFDGAVGDSAMDLGRGALQSEEPVYDSSPVQSEVLRDIVNEFARREASFEDRKETRDPTVVMLYMLIASVFCRRAEDRKLVQAEIGRRLGQKALEELPRQSVQGQHLFVRMKRDVVDAAWVRRLRPEYHEIISGKILFILLGAIRENGDIILKTNSSYGRSDHNHSDTEALLQMLTALLRAAPALADESRIVSYPSVISFLKYVRENVVEYVRDELGMKIRIAYLDLLAALCASGGDGSRTVSALVKEGDRDNWGRYFEFLQDESAEVLLRQRHLVRALLSLIRAVLLGGKSALNEKKSGNADATAATTEWSMFGGPTRMMKILFRIVQLKVNPRQGYDREYGYDDDGPSPQDEAAAALPQLKADALDTLAALGRVNFNVAKLVWQQLDRARVVPRLQRGVLGPTLPVRGIVRDLERVEAKLRMYPLTDAFIRTVGTLIGSIRGLPLWPLRSQYSLAPYMCFVVDSVLVKVDRFNYLDSRRMAAGAGLEAGGGDPSRSLRDAAGGGGDSRTLIGAGVAGGSSAAPSQRFWMWRLAASSLMFCVRLLEAFRPMQRGSGLDTAGADLMRRLGKGGGLFSVLVRLLTRAEETIRKLKRNAEGEIGIGAAPDVASEEELRVETVLRLVLRVIKLALDREEAFKEQLQRVDPNASFEFVSRQLLRAPNDAVLAIARSVGHDQAGAELCFYAAKTLLLLTRRDSRLVVNKVRNARQEDIIRHAFRVRFNRTDDSLAEGQRRGLPWDVKCKIALAQTLLQNLNAPGAAAGDTTLTHILLGFPEEHTEGGAAVVDRGGCLEWMLDKASKPAFGRQYPALAEICFELFYRLYADRLASHRFAVHLQERTIEGDNRSFLLRLLDKQCRNDTGDIASRAPVLFQRAWLLHAAALVVFVPNFKSMGDREGDAEFVGEDVRIDFDFVQQDENGRSSLMEILDSIYVPVPKGSRVQSLLQRTGHPIQMFRRARGGTPQDFLYDLGKIWAYSSSLRPEERKQLVRAAKEENNRIVLLQACRKAGEGWRRLVEVCLFYKSAKARDATRRADEEAGGAVQDVAMLNATLISMLTRIVDRLASGDSGWQRWLGPPLSSVAFSVVTSLRLLARTKARGGGTSGASALAGQDLPLKMLRAIVDSSNEQGMRANLYATFANYVAFLKEATNLANGIGNDGGDVYKSYGQTMRALCGGKNEQLALGALEIASKDVLLSGQDRRLSAMAMTFLSTMVSCEVQARGGVGGGTASSKFRLVGYLRRNGRIRSLVRMLINVERLSLLQRAVTSVRLVHNDQLVSFEVLTSLLVKIALTPEGARTLQEFRLISYFAGLPQSDAAPNVLKKPQPSRSEFQLLAEMPGTYRTRTHRYYMVLVPILQLIGTLMAQRQAGDPVNIQLREQVQNFLVAHCADMKAVLNEAAEWPRTQQASRSSAVISLQACKHLTGVVAMLMCSPPVPRRGADSKGYRGVRADETTFHDSRILQDEPVGYARFDSTKAELLGDMVETLRRLSAPEADQMIANDFEEREMERERMGADVKLPSRRGDTGLDVVGNLVNEIRKNVLMACCVAQDQGIAPASLFGSLPKDLGDLGVGRLGIGRGNTGKPWTHRGVETRVATAGPGAMVVADDLKGQNVVVEVLEDVLRDAKQFVGRIPEHSGDEELGSPEGAAALREGARLAFRVLEVGFHVLYNYCAERQRRRLNPREAERLHKMIQPKLQMTHDLLKKTHMLVKNREISQVTVESIRAMVKRLYRVLSSSV